MHANHYVKLLIMTVLSFLAMYVLMYAMVNTFSDVYPNINQFYMAGLMAAPMVVIELLLMGGMYENKTANIAILVAAVVVGTAFFLLIRQQTAVADTQFLKSMIPHHSGAILMCENAPLTDSEIKKLCQEIIESQRREIAQMKAMLNTRLK